MTKSRGILPPRKPWTEPEIELLRAEYPDTLTRELAARLGRGESTVHAKANALGIHKSAAFMSGPMAQLLDGHRGFGTRFKKGNVPPHTGTRRPGYAPGNSGRTQFKKGQLVGRNAARFIDVGGHRVNSEGYLDRKLRNDGPTQNRWERVHRLVWIEANGPIPEDHVIVFRPGMKTVLLEEIVVERLECITRGALAIRNQAPPELQRIHQLRGQLTRQINKRAKEEEHCE